jgi:hypothetical protein
MVLAGTAQVAVPAGALAETDRVATDRVATVTAETKAETETKAATKAATTRMLP